MQFLQGHPSPVTSLAFSPYGDKLLAGHKGGALELWEGDERCLDFPLGLLTQGPINAVDFHPENGVAVGGAMGWRTNISYVPAANRKPSTALKLATADPTALSVTSLKFLGPELLAVGVGDRTKPGGGAFELWNPITMKRREPHFPSVEGVRAIAVVPALKRVAWAEWNRRASVWDITQAEPWRINLPHAPTTIALHPHGAQVALTQQWEVQLFDTTNRRLLGILKGAKGTVTSLAFSPDGRTLAAGSWDGTVRLWDPARGTERACFSWPIGKVTALTFDPEGLRLAVGGDTGTICMFDLD